MRRLRGVLQTARLLAARPATPASELTVRDPSGMRLLEEKLALRSQDVRVSDESLTSLPDFLWDPSGPKALAVSNVPVAEVPPAVGRLRGLLRLELVLPSSIEWLPPELGELESLVDLEIMGDGLRALPSEVGMLTGLKRLQISGKELNAIPDLSSLQELRSLTLHCSQLEHVPSGLESLAQLKELKLIGSGLRTLPAAVGQLKALQFLDVSSNRIDELPAWLGDLPNLKLVDASSNTLKSVPSALCAREGLEVDVRDNPLPVATLASCQHSKPSAPNQLGTRE